MCTFFKNRNMFLPWNPTLTGITSIKSENWLIFERMKQSCAKYLNYVHFILVTFE